MRAPSEEVSTVDTGARGVGQDAETVEPLNPPTGGRWG